MASETKQTWQTWPFRKLGPTLAAITLGLAACGGAQTAPQPTTGPSGAQGSSDAAEPGTAADGPQDASSGGDSADGKKTTDAGVFQINEAKEGSAASAHGATPSKIKATNTEAALKFFVVNKDDNKTPIPGIVISLTAPDGAKYYTQETDSAGYAEVLVPIGQTYDLVYLSLGRHNIAAKVPVSNEPRQSIKLTMRYKRYDYVGDEVAAEEATPRFILKGIEFATGKAILTPASRTRLDTVVEFMTHKPSARIEISGHTDNVGNAKANKRLSQKRADACKAYLVSKGITADRIDAIGYGDERPLASNDTAEGRQKNRRIEAREL